MTAEQEAAVTPTSLGPQIPQSVTQAVDDLRRPSTSLTQPIRASERPVIGVGRVNRAGFLVADDRGFIYLPWPVEGGGHRAVRGRKSILRGQKAFHGRLHEVA